MDFSLTLPMLVTAAGAFLLFKLRFFFVTRPKRTVRIFINSISAPSARKALSLALAGTLGVGNIFGVAAGIMIGGAGSVFWLLVSSVFAMIIKYAECVLALDCNGDGQGGMHCVLKKTLGRFGAPISYLYAVLCLSLSLFMGSAIQSNAVADVASSALKLNPIFCAIILCVTVFAGVVGGGTKIENLTSKLIPMATIVYITATICILVANFSKLPDVIFDIFSSAFTARSAGGGAIAFISTRALREGYARGILSNEAGCGTSAMAHTRADERTPAEAGLCGMCEVFFDTVVLCPLTALAVLVTVPSPESFITPMSLVSFAFTSTLGEWSAYLLLASIAVFAYSTIICWYYYGGECAAYLLGRRARLPFALLFFSCVFIGSLTNAQPLIFSTDLILVLMSFLTLFAVMRKSDRILTLTRDGGLL